MRFHSSYRFLKALTVFRSFISSGIRFQLLMTLTVKKFFLQSSRTFSMNNTSFRSCCSSLSVTETVERVAREFPAFRKLNHFDMSTRLKPFIVRNVSIISLMPPLPPLNQRRQTATFQSPLFKILDNSIQGRFVVQVNIRKAAFFYTI